MGAEEEQFRQKGGTFPGAVLPAQICYFLPAPPSKFFCITFLLCFEKYEDWNLLRIE